jgi:peptide deformylase
MIVNMSSLIKEEDPILRQIAEPVEFPLSEEDLETLKAMAMFVMESQTKEKDDEGNLYVPSVGIAAPQIGISKQMFVISTADDNNDLIIMAVVNPKIVQTSKSFISLSSGESCLSVQSVKSGKVARYEKIRWTGYLINLQTGEMTKKENSPLGGYIGIVFQHEYDHLGGILFKDLIDSRELTKEEQEFLDQYKKETE